MLPSACATSGSQEPPLRAWHAAAGFEEASRYSGSNFAVPAAQEERQAREILVGLGAMDWAPMVLSGG
jgi:hypothetical protein